MVGPGAADRAEHVAAEDPGAEPGHATRCEILVHAAGPALLAEHLLEGAGAESPLVQRHAADAERIVERLVGPGAVAVDGDAEAIHPDSGHGTLSIKVIVFQNQLQLVTIAFALQVWPCGA